MDKQLLRVGEAAQALNVSRWTIYRWVEEGRLESARIGKGSLRIFRASLMALIERGRTESFNLIRKGAGMRVRNVIDDTRKR
jgi:excisionase family DNA binding protein